MLQIIYTAGMSKMPAERQNVQALGGNSGERLTKPVSANWSSAECICRGHLAVIKSSSGPAAVHTAGEQRRCFQIPDSLKMFVAATARGVAAGQVASP
jgi:hypothetical protein